MSNEELFSGASGRIDALEERDEEIGQLARDMLSFVQKLVGGGFGDEDPRELLAKLRQRNTAVFQQRGASVSQVTEITERLNELEALLKVGELIKEARESVDAVFDV